MKKHFSFLLVFIILFLVCKSNVQAIECIYIGSAEKGSTSFVVINSSGEFTRINGAYKMFNITNKDIKFGEECPSTIYFQGTGNGLLDLFAYSSKPKEDEKKDILELKNVSKIVQSELTETKTDDKEINCKSNIFPKTKKIINGLYNLIRFIVPAIIIVLSTIEFVGVIFSGEQDKMEKAKKRFIMRLIAGALFLFVPILLELILKTAKIIPSSGNLTDLTCIFFE